MGGREVRTGRDSHFEGATEFCDVMPSGGSDREVGRRDKVFSLHKGNSYKTQPDWASIERSRNVNFLM